MKILDWLLGKAGYRLAVQNNTAQLGLRDAGVERELCMARHGFKWVYNPFRWPGDAEGFDENAEYEFMRSEWDKPVVMRLADFDPGTNVWRLYYRSVDTPAPK